MVSSITWLDPSLNVTTTTICFWPGGQSVGEDGINFITAPTLGGAYVEPESAKVPLPSVVCQTDPLGAVILIAVSESSSCYPW